ncbi:Uncharacterized protein TCAP_02798 [Tolypocladium capitatum]|uniref:Uncharacterized protein n=1 Tax=Tolypocladium capitatum TaxID=45235 RepID=A0A2K3QIA9_9HYPO|nr:Uncharacterized protein TCAP_02798 [Tolypocladium capitatum]
MRSPHLHESTSLPPTSQGARRPWQRNRGGQRRTAWSPTFPPPSRRRANSRQACQEPGCIGLRLGSVTPVWAEFATPSSMAQQQQHHRGHAGSGDGSPRARRWGRQQMEPLVDLEIMSVAARVHVDNDASFLLSSPTSSVAASTSVIIRTSTATEAAASVLGATTANTATTSTAAARPTASCPGSASAIASCVSAGGIGGGDSSSSMAARHPHLVQLQLNVGHGHHGHHHHHRHHRPQRSLGKLDDAGSEGHIQDEPAPHNRRHGLRLFDNYLWPDQRPSSYPNHQPRSSRGNSKAPVHAPPKNVRASSDEASACIDSLASSVAMTRDEFEALPPTIQRKYFSTLERLRFARNAHAFDNPVAGVEPSHRRSPSPSTREEDEIQPTPLRLGFGSDELDNAPHRRSQLNYKPVRLNAHPAESRRIQRHRSCDQLASHHRCQSVILDATDEAYMRIGKRQSKTLSRDGPFDAPTTLQPAAKMHSSTADRAKRSPDVKKTADSIYDSFRWLEEEEELDLRLYLDDYHYNLREEVSAPSNHRRPSFRRHLSINKLPFGGGRMSGTVGRPATKDAAMSPTFVGSPTCSVSRSPSHVRRRPRALSLMSPNKQTLPDASAVSAAMDPAASHYQDPDARMKLRVYLASPHKFDEAIEFGFPSIDEVHGKENETHEKPGSCQGTPKLRTFLEDDISSMYSEASAADPESPRTPEAVEKQLPARPTRASQDPGATPKVDYAQAPASSREMTLRMTLTRPDLRAHEDQMYGWQKSPVGRMSQTRDEPHLPLPYAREGNSKEIIERHFAAMDQEDLANENGVVRRFWNRVRRT